MVTQEQLRAIKNAIAHLNGYALIIKARTGYNPVAVDDCINELKKLNEGLNNK